MSDQSGPGRALLTIDDTPTTRRARREILLGAEESGLPGWAIASVTLVIAAANTMSFLRGKREWGWEQTIRVTLWRRLRCRAYAICWAVRWWLGVSLTSQVSSCAR